LLVELGVAESLVDGRAAVGHLEEALALTTDRFSFLVLASITSSVLTTISQRTRDAVALAATALVTGRA
jgi:hypothetical protein